MSIQTPTQKENKDCILPSPDLLLGICFWDEALPIKHREIRNGENIKTDRNTGQSLVSKQTEQVEIADEWTGFLFCGDAIVPPN